MHPESEAHSSRSQATSKKRKSSRRLPCKLFVRRREAKPASRSLHLDEKRGMSDGWEDTVLGQVRREQLLAHSVKINKNASDQRSVGASS